MAIEREIMKRLEEWKNSPRRKPALIKGARQIGKSWVMREFGRKCYAHTAVFDFDEKPELQNVFKVSKDPLRLIKDLALYTDVPLLPGETLLVFDEIQDCEEALNSLKYFHENAPEYHIMAAGSLLGVAVRQKKMKVPVGQVDIFNMYPLSFREYLFAADAQTARYVDQMERVGHLPEIILNKLKTEYRRFLVCGGMPEAASAMIDGEGMAVVDRILTSILAFYEVDFAKYATPLQVTRIRALWHSLPAQLSKENRKFQYGVIKSGARSKDYEDALTWLEDAGVVYRIHNIAKPALPLSAYADNSAFKLYASDTGLLRSLARLSAEAVLNPTHGYTEFKGAMAENAVLQSLMPMRNGNVPFYWSADSRAEIEFVIDEGVDVIPIEVKAEDCVSGRSLTVYNDKFSPRVRIRCSMLNLQFNDNLLSVPAPLCGWMRKWLKML